MIYDPMSCTSTANCWLCGYSTFTADKIDDKEIVDTHTYCITVLLGVFIAEFAFLYNNI